MAALAETAEGVPEEDIGELLIIVALALASGVLAGAEIAVIALRRSRLNELVEEHKRGARAVQRLRDQPERFFATVQIGITVIGTAAGALGGRSLAADLEAWLASKPYLAAYARPLSFGLVISLVSYLTLVLGELVPKSLALRAAESYATVVGRPLWLLSSLARPLVRLLTGSSNAVLRLFGDRTTFTEARLTTSELSSLVDEATREGSLHPRAADMAMRAIDFASLEVDELMVPRTAVVALRYDATPEEVRRVLLEVGHEHLPVYRENIDDIEGVLRRSDVLALAWERQLFVLHDLVRPVLFVHEGMRAIAVLQDMQARHVRFAVVADERGGTAGIVTLSDLLGEIVGELLRERQGSDDGTLSAEPGGDYLVPGSMTVREANRDLPFDLPEGEGYSTVGGLVVAVAGRIPGVGESFTAEGGARLEVIEATPRRVRRVRVRPPPEPPAAETAQERPTA